MTEVGRPGASWRVSEPPAPGWILASGDLPDINVWLALAVREHPFHAAARAYWQEARAQDTRLWFCRTTMLGLVRLLCQPKGVGKGALALPQALRLYRQWSEVPDIGLLPEPPDADKLLDRFAATTKPPLPTRLWTDAWLAATAEAAGLRLVTFDADFARFGLTRHLLLKNR